MEPETKFEGEDVRFILRHEHLSKTQKEEKLLRYLEERSGEMRVEELDPCFVNFPDILYKTAVYSCFKVMELLLKHPKLRLNLICQSGRSTLDLILCHFNTIHLWRLFFDDPRLNIYIPQARSNEINLITEIVKHNPLKENFMHMVSSFWLIPFLMVKDASERLRKWSSNSISKYEMTTSYLESPFEFVKKTRKQLNIEGMPPFFFFL